MSRRVVVTGLGAVTPIGNNVDDFWAAVKAGKIGFDHITKFDTTDYKCHIAAELKDFNPQDFMDRKAAKRMRYSSSFSGCSAISSARVLPSMKVEMIAHFPSIFVTSSIFGILSPVSSTLA